LLFRKRHVLTLAATNRLRLERLDPAAVISHVGAVHGAQRNAHRFGYRGLRHSAFAQQHHLDALALRRRDFPPQGCFQLPDLLLGALDHPFPPNQMVKANHITSLSASQKNTANPRFKQLWKRYQAGALQFFGKHTRLIDPRAFAAYLAPLWNTKWVVYCKRPFG